MKIIAISDKENCLPTSWKYCKCVEDKLCLIMAFLFLKCYQLSYLLLRVTPLVFKQDLSPSSANTFLLLYELFPTRGHQHLFILRDERPLYVSLYIFSFLKLRALYKYFSIHHHNIWDETDIVILILLMRKHRWSYLLTALEYKGSQYTSGYSSVKQFWNKRLNP